MKIAIFGLLTVVLLVVVLLGVSRGPSEHPAKPSENAVGQNAQDPSPDTRPTPPIVAAPNALPTNAPAALDLVFPRDLPDDLKFLVDADHAEPEQLQALQKLAEGPYEERAGAAMRWALFQSSVSPTVKNEIAKTLAAQNCPQLQADLQKIVGDDMQPAQWRSWCLQHVLEHYRKSKDKESLAVIFGALSSGNELLESQAIFSGAEVCSEFSAEPAVSIKKPMLVSRIGEILGAREVQGILVESAIDASRMLELRIYSPEIEHRAASADVGVAVAALRALALIGRKESKSAIEQCLSSQNVMVSKFAKKADEMLRARGAY